MVVVVVVVEVVVVVVVEVVVKELDSGINFRDGEGYLLGEVRVVESGDMSRC
jgi:hypothetical protein